MNSVEIVEAGGGIATILHHCLHNLCDPIGTASLSKLLRFGQRLNVPSANHLQAVPAHNGQLLIIYTHPRIATSPRQREKAGGVWNRDSGS